MPLPRPLIMTKSARQCAPSSTALRPEIPLLFAVLACFVARAQQAYGSTSVPAAQSCHVVFSTSAWLRPPCWAQKSWPPAQPGQYRSCRAKPLKPCPGRAAQARKMLRAPFRAGADQRARVKPARCVRASSDSACWAASASATSMCWQTSSVAASSQPRTSIVNCTSRQ